MTWWLPCRFAVNLSLFVWHLSQTEATNQIADTLQWRGWRFIYLDIYLFMFPNELEFEIFYFSTWFLCLYWSPEKDLPVSSLWWWSMPFVQLSKTFQCRHEIRSQCFSLESARILKIMRTAFSLLLNPCWGLKQPVTLGKKSSSCSNLFGWYMSSSIFVDRQARNIVDWGGRHNRAHSWTSSLTICRQTTFSLTHSMSLDC